MGHHIYLLMRKTTYSLAIAAKCFGLLTEIGTALRAAYKPLLIYPNIPASSHAIHSMYPKIVFVLHRSSSFVHLQSMLHLFRRMFNLHTS